MKQPKTYEAAVKELELIMQKLENEELGIDILADQLARARELVDFCKVRLAKVDADIKRVMTTDKTDG